MNDKNFAGNSKSCVDILGNEWHYDCMGCAIGRSDIETPGGVIFAGDIAILAADPEIPIPGFLVVNVKKHINSFSDLNPSERVEIVNVITHAEKALKELGVTKEITIVQEERSKHFHVWLFPTHEWMVEKFGKGISYLRDISQYAKENANEETIAQVLSIVDNVRKYFQEHDITK